MKVIDLLNKIAKGEIPERIKYDDKIWHYENNFEDYITDDDSRIDWRYTIMEYINDEVEIIEEEKKIPEKINIELNSDDENKVNCYRATNLECDLAFKINSIIDYLQSKGE